MRSSARKIVDTVSTLVTGPGCGAGTAVGVRAGDDGPMAAQEPTPAMETADRLLARLRAAQRAPAAQRAGVLEEIVEACRTGPPELAEEFWLPELLEELARAYGELGRLDEALATVQQAIDAGWDGVPDPRCIAAELAYRGGRRELAEEIWARVRVDTPDDWWLYNAVGLEKGDGGEHADAVAWLGAGLEVAMEAGDPDRLVAQLCDLREASLAALDLPGDELQERAERFLADSRPRPDRAASAPPPAPVAIDPDGTSGGLLGDLSGVASGFGGPAKDGSAELTPGVGRVGFAWIPQDEYAAALTRWPVLVADGGPARGDDGRPATYRQYCRRLEEHLVSTTSAPGGGRLELVLVPVRVDGFARWCAEHGMAEDSPSARAQFAADGARLGGPELVRWPPGRKQDCWCGSWRRYKRCCGSDR
jgi:hypothetical protein